MLSHFRLMLSYFLVYFTINWKISVDLRRRNYKFIVDGYFSITCQNNKNDKK